MAKLPSNVRFIFKADMYVDDILTDSLEIGEIAMPIGITVTFDTSSDEAARAAKGETDATTNIPDASDGDGDGSGTGDLFTDEDRGWQRLSYPGSPGFPEYED
jgi:hypothetical protein